MKVLVILLLSIYSVVIGTSDGNPNLITVCDATSPLFGCDPKFWNGGDRLQCLNTTQLMNWASRSTRSDCYSVYAGTDDAKLTSYVPGEYTTINIRVTCYKMMFRGLMIYAVDANENKVGNWDIPLQEPVVWRLPWESNTHPCYGTLMHASAELKPYHSVFYFKAPPVGTGKITFRVLIKYGDANTGDFFWPMTAGDLALDEATVPKSSIVWEVSGVDQSCTEYCTSKKGTCDVTAMQAAFQGEDSFVADISSANVCKLPLISGCGDAAGSYDPETDYCYYPDSTCAQQNRSVSVITCNTKNTDAARFCACTVSSTNQEEEEVSAGESFRGAGILSILLVFPLLFAVNERMAIMLVLLLGLASAHNWINSPSRSHGASAVQPCKPSMTGLPHAQVGPGQAFQIEWMNGHGGNSYFVIQHAKYVDYLNQNTFDILDDYIANAPEGSNQAQVPNLQKFHRKDVSGLANGKVENFFYKQINKTDPLYIYRPTIFAGQVGTKLNPVDNGSIFLVQYQPKDVANDVRVSYQNPKYPWIEAVYRFQMALIQAREPDTTNFYIPGYSGTGRYIVQYLWNGYRDCVDVDYKANNVSLIYGYPTPTPTWGRIDHCLFENPRNTYFFSEVVADDPSWCLKQCETVGTNCFGVNVVPIVAPETAYQGFTPAPGANWPNAEYYGTDIYLPWAETTEAIKDAILAEASPTQYACVALQPALFTDTIPEYTVSKDPDDPIFYSTCWYRFGGNTFDDYVNKTSHDPVVGPWSFNTKCINCQTRSDNSDMDTLLVRWNVTDTCIDCDKEPVEPQPPKVVDPNLVESGARCDGLAGVFGKANHTNCTAEEIGNCYKPLYPIGRTPINADVSIEECRALAARDPDCSNIALIKLVEPQKCYCYTNLACCKDCSRRTDPAYQVYQVSTSPDPTCATGTLSSDGKSCCSGTCASCVNSAALLDSVGFCCSTCITRSCKDYGPPCLV